MLKVTVQLKSAIDGHQEDLTTALIVNDGTGTAEYGNYDITFVRDGKRVGRSRVEGHRRADSPWELLRLALEAATWARSRR